MVHQAKHEIKDAGENEKAKATLARKKGDRTSPRLIQRDINDLEL